MAGEFVEYMYVDSVNQTLYKSSHILRSSSRPLTVFNLNYLLLNLTDGIVVGYAYILTHNLFQPK